MKHRFHSFLVASAAIVICGLATGCAKDESVTDSNAPPVNIKSGVPSTVPESAPPVVSKQIQASQDAGQAMQAEAQKNAAAYQAARAKNP